MYDQFSAYAAVLQREGAQRPASSPSSAMRVVEEQIKRLQDAGATEFIGNAWGFTTVEEHDRTVAVAVGALSVESDSERAPLELAARRDAELGETFPKWYCTVRELMNSREPISGFDRPSRASRAIWASCAVRLGARSVGASAGGFAGGLQFASGALGEGFHAHRFEHVVGDAELRPRVGAAPLPSQPLAVEQVRTREIEHGYGCGRAARSTRGTSASQCHRH